VFLVKQQGLYTLGPGDQVRIDIFNVPEFSGEQQILLDGSLTLPLVGTVIVQGMTLEQAAEEISFRLSAFLERPIVNVNLLTARPLRVAVVGEVKRPGVYTVPSSASAGQVQTETGTPTQPGVPTVTLLLQTAGGITQTADVRRVQVRRSRTDGSTQNFTLDLWALLQGGDLGKDLTLLDGDSIFVPTAAALDPTEAAQLASANFAPNQILVSVVGEVKAPGRIAVPPNTPLNQAILTAGGFNPRADVDFVQLIRLNPNGSVTAREISIDLAQGINEQSNPTLQNTDIIVVNPTGIAQASDSLNIILNPIIGLRSILSIFDLAN
jgi:polysaccharide export outer membrane protein